MNLNRALDPAILEDGRVRTNQIIDLLTKSEVSWDILESGTTSRPSTGITAGMINPKMMSGNAPTVNAGIPKSIRSLSVDIQPLVNE